MRDGSRLPGRARSAERRRHPSGDFHDLIGPFKPAHMPLLSSDYGFVSPVRLRGSRSLRPLLKRYCVQSLCLAALATARAGRPAANIGTTHGLSPHLKSLDKQLRSPAMLCLPGGGLCCRPHVSRQCTRCGVDDFQIDDPFVPLQPADVVGTPIDQFLHRGDFDNFGGSLP